ncbi:hypothetical protein ACFOZ1_05580 [Gracilibacillus marinus]|uniref:Peptidyl-prolyl cis-trans isomerase n=1 Tax=Gracilibacillus marinus TaxID=630535 RepID=A0ABV8VS49_9BACI
MIIQIKGNVKFPITLDPSVWIFDDRKMVLEEAFDKKNTFTEVIEEFSGQDSNRVKPQVHNSIKKFNKNELLTNSYVMPIFDFLQTAEIHSDAQIAMIKSEKNYLEVTIDEVLNSVLLFAIDGKQIKTDGPAYFIFGDGRNKDEPFKNVTEIYFQ